MNSREELIKRLREAVSSDHARGCEGRQYACDCGHDLMIERLLEMAADEIERNGVAQRPLPMLADVAQVIANGWLRGTPAYDVAAEIMREFDVRAVTSTDRCEGE